MSGRRATTAGRSIRGPHSALTDFLASNNISAAQIRADYEARRRNAEQGDQPDGEQDNILARDEHEHDEEEENEEEDEEEEEEQEVETLAQQRKRKRQEEAALAKIKNSKAFKRRKASMRGEPGEDDDDDLALDMYEKSRPPPGQLENCELCDKRFTVTPYSKEGPNGGLLCTKCSKELKDEQKKSAKQQKKAAPRSRRRRQVQSNLLDGNVKHGAKSLADLCIEKVADVSNDIEEFGYLPDTLLERLSQLFSKKRVLNPRTSHLFLRPDLEKICLYDCGPLETNDFNQIFAIVPKIKHLKLRNAGQLKDETIDYMIDRKIQLESFQVQSCNLVSDPKWCEYFTQAGFHLKTLQLINLDFAMVDHTLEHMVAHCPNLTRLKIKHCWKLTESSLPALSKLSNLEHLSLNYVNPISTEPIHDLLTALGANLRTLSLERFDAINDVTLGIIHNECRHLDKFRLSHNDYATDAGLASLFKDWANPPLKHIDLSASRDIDNTRPEGPENTIGLGSFGLAALMEHSGAKLETLNIMSCRHVKRTALMEVFDGKKQYPCLREIDMSLIPEVDTTVLAGIFRSCPEIQKVVVFACFGVRDVQIPKGVALIGTAQAQDAVVQVGDGETVEEMLQKTMNGGKA